MEKLYVGSMSTLFLISAVVWLLGLGGDLRVVPKGEGGRVGAWLVLVITTSVFVGVGALAGPTSPQEEWWWRGWGGVLVTGIVLLTHGMLRRSVGVVLMGIALVVVVSIGV